MNKRKLTLLLIDSAIFFFVTLAFSMIYPYISSNKLDVSLIIGKMSLLLVLMLVTRYILGVYTSILRYSNVRAYIKLVFADAYAYILFIILVFLFPVLRPGMAFTTIIVMAVMLASLVSRFAYQLLYANRHRAEDMRNGSTKENKINIAIVGAGNVGASLAYELIRNPSASYKPICFVDTDKGKIGNKLHELPIYSESKETLIHFREAGVKEVIIALPEASNEVKAKLFEQYSSYGLKVKMYDFGGSYSHSTQSNKMVIRNFKIEELLFRNTINLDSESKRAFYKGKTVLVTGGGGSIGSELCRQIIKLGPKKLIIVDIYENNAYEIQQELIRTYSSELPLEVLIASVRDADRIDSIFAKYRPDIVFHAAAHKHVPLMETSPMEAIKNNVFGTYNVANAAEKYGVEKFILISTDKAVNPTNIMGASKRLCEKIIQCRTDSKTIFTAVRFGNVLGSNGSVIPLFKEQILSGGPVTLTDKRITRYFMTIPEAVGLVMEAGSFAKDGELFVLDMGKPIKILSLAEKMISLMGLEPYTDIDIVEIGLRKGEKLYEELLIKSENLAKTSNDLIFIEHDRPDSRESMEKALDELRSAMAKNDISSAVEAVAKHVPTYCPAEVFNKTVEDSLEDENVIIC